VQELVITFVTVKEIYVLKAQLNHTMPLSNVGSIGWIPWLRTAFVFKRSWLHPEGKAWKCFDNCCNL